MAMTSSLHPHCRHRSQIFCASGLPRRNAVVAVESQPRLRTRSDSFGGHFSVKVNSSIRSVVWSRLRRRELVVRCAGRRDGIEVVERPEVEEIEGILPPGWPTVGLVLFGVGFLLGPPLDGIHSRVQLQIYDSGAIDIFGLKTNIWVPPLLGVFYSVVGLLQLALDRWLAPNERVPQADLQKVVASFLTLALLLELSAEMYKAGVPFNIEAYILFALAELNWFLVENTWWGFALACFVGLACPLAEIPILKLFGLWHYPKANLEISGVGIITWVVCCYFFYTPFISNLARWLSTAIKKGSIKLKHYHI